MDDIILLSASSCAVLALLVYLMYKSATSSEWQTLTHTEKTRWRNEEEENKEKAAAKTGKTSLSERAASAERAMPAERTIPSRALPASAKKRKSIPNSAS